MQSHSKELASVFAESSESDTTFYGFSDGELDDKNSIFEDEDQPGVSPKEQKATSKASSAAQPFKLRVALRSTPFTKQSTDDEDPEGEVKRIINRGMRQTGRSSPAKEKRHVKFEDEETAVTWLSPSEESGSDSAEDSTGSFLAKREQNIKANKAMLAQLMADLQKIPGGAGFLKKKEEDKQKTKRPPRSVAAGRESRRNPERASRRRTRSMGRCDDSTGPLEEKPELSLEEELLEVRRAPQHRGAPRPNQSKPHFIRLVEDITEDELQLVADNMTDKVYNRVTGSTCHQCRQKTVDTKTCCRSETCRGIQGQFCGPCLRNRYGEDIKKALLDPKWKCPPCRGICNCSFCRQREGHCPTGILFPLAQYYGFSDVHSYLSSLRHKLKSEYDDTEM